MKRLIYSMFLVLGAVFFCTGCQKDDPSKFAISDYMVTFNSQGGSSVDSQKVEKGAKITKPENPEYGEFIFVDWFKEPACINVWDFNKDVVDTNITLYSKWTFITYTVTFVMNGGSKIIPLSVAKGSTAAKPLPPLKEGVAFDNWYKEAALSNMYDFNTPVTSDIILYAKWVPVSRLILERLIAESHWIMEPNYGYTQESYNALEEKRMFAVRVLMESYASLSQITIAYTRLLEAINALVPLPYRPVVAIAMNAPNDILYIHPGSEVSLWGNAVDSKSNPATDPRLIFIYDVSQLATWADNDVFVVPNRMGFNAKKNLLPGQTIFITLKSAENPTVTKTITLQVV